MGSVSSKEKEENQRRLKEDRGEGVRSWRRSMSDMSLDDIRQDIASIKIDTDPDMKANIVLFGSVCAGKSSFAKSILSIDQGRLNYNPAVGTQGSRNVTFRYSVYEPDNILKNVRIIDLPGLMEATEMGLNPDDFENILDGIIEKRYKFNPIAKFGRHGELNNESLSLKDKVHCVVIVVEASAVTYLHQKQIDKIQKLQNLTREKDIPTFVMLTKCDLECKGVQEDKTRIFKSRTILRAVKKAEERFYVPMAHIHPVVNFGAEEAAYMDPNISRSLLYALQQFVNASKDYVKYQKKGC